MLSFVKFEPTESNETTVIRARTFDGKPVQMEIIHSYERCQKALWDYNQGAKIQDAFGFLTVDERNFMQCGMTAEEFDEAFDERKNRRSPATTEPPATEPPTPEPTDWKKAQDYRPAETCQRCKHCTALHETYDIVDFYCTYAYKGIPPRTTDRMTPAEREEFMKFAEGREVRPDDTCAVYVRSK